ncbi:PQQ-binding-like beta-propeller repeat protein [Proteobacteria bacterium 005FR1]|nr:PQQ-binding-like beta-propeller repeat protein [Proteobacteria bacterium 005FR1]
MARLRRHLVTLLVGCTAVGAANLALAAADDPGQAIYLERCAACHDNPQGYTPPRSTIALRSPEYVLDILEKGTMQVQAQGLSRKDREQLATYLTGRTLGAAEGAAFDDWDVNYCAHKPAPIGGSDFHWNGWGRDLAGSRYQPQPGMSAGDLPKLKVKWAFAYPGGRVNSQPTLIGDRVLVGSRPGAVYSLDAATGCTHWTADVGSGMRAAISVVALPGSEPARYVAIVGTADRDVIALDADSGEKLWSTKVESHPHGVITGSPIVVKDTIVVPLSSIEEATARNEQYECCTFTGSIVALDLASGEMLWKTRTIEQQAQPFRKSAAGSQMHGPAGAAIWSAPSFDEQRGLIYAATGDSYTDVPEPGSDAVIALDLRSGKMVWRHQVTEGDNYVMGCIGGAHHANCPEEMGPDYDFGSTPIIARVPDGQGGNRTLLLAGQKSGIIYAMDPDRKGDIVWQQRPGLGSVRGGIQWGSAADEDTVYTAVSDAVAPPDVRRPGLSAFDIATGKLRWHTPAPEGECIQQGNRLICTNGQSAAVSAIPGAVFSGALNGMFRAYDSRNGRIIWEVDMHQLRVKSVNGLLVRGGNMDATGPTVANGTLYVNAGYGGIEGQPGNVLFAFSVEGE